MLSTALSYQMLTKNLPRSLDSVAANPTVQRTSDYYLAKIGGVKSIDAFLKDDRLYRYAMKAFGLEEMTYAKAFMRKALEGGIDAPDAFANQLSDKRYRDFVEAFNFVRYGGATTAFDRTQQGTVDKYLRQTLEENAGVENEGVRLALYFERKASGISSMLSILADPALLKVVQTALSIPAATGALDLDKQVALIKKRLDLADLKDPAKLAKFMTRFTSLWEVQNRSSASASPAVMLISGPRESGIRSDLLQSLQRLKLGGF